MCHSSDTSVQSSVSFLVCPNFERHGGEVLRPPPNPSSQSFLPSSPSLSFLSWLLFFDLVFCFLILICFVLILHSIVLGFLFNVCKQERTKAHFWHIEYGSKPFAFKACMITILYFLWGHMFKKCTMTW